MIFAWTHSGILSHEETGPASQFKITDHSIQGMTEAEHKMTIFSGKTIVCYS